MIFEKKYLFDKFEFKSVFICRLKLCRYGYLFCHCKYHDSDIKLLLL